MNDHTGGTVVSRFRVEVEQVEGFELQARFDKPQYGALTMDEPAPLGHDSAPNPARILAAAIGDCLAASFIFCMKRQGVAVSGLKSEVDVEIVRNEHKRLRIGKVDVRIVPRLEDDVAAREACLALFEDFCVVTQSVRDGLDVRVRVEPD